MEAARAGPRAAGVLRRSAALGLSAADHLARNDAYPFFAALLGWLGVAITGTEQVGFTLILTEGFGTIPMAQKTFKLLSAHAGQKAAISGATQIRAGVIRPEIIIAKPAGAARTGVAAAPQREGIRIGDPVRIIRDPLFGIDTGAGRGGFENRWIRCQGEGISPTGTSISAGDRPARRSRRSAARSRRRGG